MLFTLTAIWGSRLRAIVTTLKCIIALAVLLVVISGCSSENSVKVPVPPISGQWNAASEPAFVEYSFSSQYGDDEQWVSGFGEALLSQWVSPYAYRLELISGFTVVRVVVASSGALVESVVEDSLGHASLHSASTAALDNMGPVSPLPENFGATNFEFRLTFTYPQGERLTGG